jgi:hypothetical protein
LTIHEKLIKYALFLLGFRLSLKGENVSDHLDVQERRRYPRWDSLNLISYTHFDEDDVADNGGMGRTLDFSKGGVTIQTHKPLPTHSGLEITIAFAEKIIAARVRVVHVYKIDEDRYDIGVCFTQIGEEDLKSLLTNFENST